MKVLNSRLGLLLLALGLVVAPGGCSIFGGKKPAVPAVSDGAIVERIRDRLAQSPELKGAQVTVQSANGIVELTGRVESLAQKNRAGLIAASTAEVAEVHNDVVISAAPVR